VCGGVSAGAKARVKISLHRLRRTLAHSVGFDQLKCVVIYVVIYMHTYDVHLRYTFMFMHAYNMRENTHMKMYIHKYIHIYVC